jgi:hypothetical protein
MMSLCENNMTNANHFDDDGPIHTHRPHTPATRDPRPAALREILYKNKKK